MPAGTADWTDAEKVELRRLWDEGRSASQISRALGCRSRAAVCGMARRLNLATRLQTPAIASTTRRVRGQQTAQPRVPVTADIRRIPAEAWAALPGTSPVALVDITDGMCRWPIGLDRPYTFCGATTAAPGPYCLVHGERAKSDWRRQ